MFNATNPDLAEVAQCVQKSLLGVLQLKRKKAPVAISDSTVLAGIRGALLDSLALVMFFADLEQEAEWRWGVSLDLFGEVLDKKDGTLTLQTLTAYIHGVVRNSNCHSTSFLESELQ